MQEKIIEAAGILIALVCAVVGWWMENGPAPKNSDEKKNQQDAVKEEEMEK